MIPSVPFLTSRLRPDRAPRAADADVPWLDNASALTRRHHPGTEIPVLRRPMLVFMFTDPSASIMSLVRRRAVVLVLAVAVATGCSSGSSRPAAIVGTETLDASPNAPTATSGTSRAMPLSAEHICHRVLHSAVLLAWAPGTVAQFRAYQYGGPQPTVPLADAFPGVPGGTRGAWCGTKAGRQATEWWAVIPGHPAAFAIGVSGPGEGVRTGAVSGAPIVS
jgi:hypothetical protein